MTITNPPDNTPNDLPRPDEGSDPSPSTPTDRFDQRAVDDHPSVLAAQFSLPEVVCCLIDACVVAGTIGPVRLVIDPVTGLSSSLSLNVLLRAPPESTAAVAALRSISAFHRLVATAGATNAAYGSKKLRARRIELEQICEELIRQIQDPRIPPLEPFCIVPPHEIAKKDEQIALIPSCEHAAGIMLEHGLIERPGVICEALTADEVADLGKYSFDGSVFSISPEGDALAASLQQSLAKRRRLGRALFPTWSGDQPASSSSGRAISHLWVASSSLIEQAVEDPALEPFLRTFLIVDAGRGDISTSVPATDWDRMLTSLVEVRLRQTTIEYRLDQVGEELLTDYTNRTRERSRGLSERLARVTALWRRQVLKLAGIFHVTAGRVDDVIPADSVVRAIALMDEIGEEQLDARRSPDSVERNLNIMVAKVREYGPLTRRQLFRRYDDQNYERLDAILRFGLERSVIREEDGQLSGAVSVSDEIS